MTDQQTMIPPKYEFEFDSATLKLATEQTIDGIAFADLEGKIQFSNGSWAIMHGFTVQELIGKPLSLFHNEEQMRRDVEPFNAQVMARGAYEAEVGHVDKNGTPFPTWMSVTLVCDDDGAPVGLLAVARDITDQKKLESNLKSALGKAELAMEKAMDASKSKSEFLATVSHELRTPMNGIIGMTGLVLNSKLTNELRSNIETIRVSSDNLLSIIDEILDFSKIEGGQLKLESEPFSIRQIIQEVLDLITPIATQKGIEVRSEITDSVPGLVIGDSGRIRQVLMNLAGNAVKFTTEGEVTIKVASNQSSPAFTELICSISDTGIGIPSEMLDTIFNPFSQVESTTTRNFGGTGLGLSISRKLAEALDGRLEVESIEGEGSRFHLTLSLPIGTDHKHYPEEENDLATATERLQTLVDSDPIRVLIVEDNRINQRVALKQLELEGIHAEVVADGQEAVSALSELPYDLVLMDCQMPVMDGYEATRRIRNGEAGVGNTNIHIIALTANVMAEDRDRVLKAGMNHYLAKPAKLHTLHGTIADWLENRWRP